MATIGTAVVLDDVNWIMVASASALAGVLSILTSIAGLPEVPKWEEVKWFRRYVNIVWYKKYFRTTRKKNIYIV